MPSPKANRRSPMGLGTPQFPFQLANPNPIEYNGGEDQIESRGLVRQFPTDSPVGEGLLVLGPFDSTTAINLRFSALQATDATLVTASVNLWFLHELTNPRTSDVEWLYAPMAYLKLAVGTNAIDPASKIMPRPAGYGSHIWVDDIQVVHDYSLNAVVFTKALNGVATLSIDRAAAPYVALQASVDIVSGLYVLYQEM